MESLAPLSAKIIFNRVELQLIFIVDLPNLSELSGNKGEREMSSECLPFMKCLIIENRLVLPTGKPLKGDFVRKSLAFESDSHKQGRSRKQLKRL